MDLLKMLDQLQEVVVEKPRYLGRIAWGLNRDDIAIQIAKIKASVPNEVKQAVSVTKDSERIVEKAREDGDQILSNAQIEANEIREAAHAEAAKILEQARLQQELMISDSEVLKLSKSQAEEVRVNAERDAITMKRGAEDYAYAILSKLEGVVGKVHTSIESGKEEIRLAESQPSLNIQVVPEREKVQLR